MKENKKKSISLDVTSKKENVPIVVKALEEFCSKQKIEQKIIDTLLIATDEALTNIVMYAYDGSLDGKIIVNFDIEDDEFIITLTDYGKHFKPPKIKKKDISKIENLKVGGYGLILMDNLMDELKFFHDKETKMNNVVMKKKLNN